jgi:hypothetical protein
MFSCCRENGHPITRHTITTGIFMRYRARSFTLLFLLAAFAATVVAGAQQATPENTPATHVQTATTASSPTTTATVALQGSLASKSSPKGAEVKAIFRRPATLPDGETLPKGTVLLGRVVEVLPHSKAKPNGAMLLLFEEARKKDGTSIPLSVKIQSLSDGDDVDDSTPAASPPTKSGGTANDHSAAVSNTRPSGLDGVFLQSTPGGSGIVFSAGADVYLDTGTHITLLITRTPTSDKPVSQ